MPQEQRELRLPAPSDGMEETEQEKEARLALVFLRHIGEAVREVGTKNVCYALAIGEEVLSKQLREVENRKPSYRLVAYLLKAQPSGRLAKWLLCDYAGYLAPRRPDLLEPSEAMREVVTLALAGEVGNAAKEKILALYERMRRQEA